MSTSLAKLHNIFVYAPYKVDAGLNERRSKVRAAHLERLGAFKTNGKLKLGGPFFTPESIASETAEKQAIGSMMVWEVETLDEVKKVIESDVYYTEGVWDAEKLVISPVML